jgi:hypothetical protein
MTLFSPWLSSILIGPYAFLPIDHALNNTIIIIYDNNLYPPKI